MENNLRESSRKPRISIIAAIGKNNELGRNNDLLWRLKSDMDFFKRTTTNHWVVMGRKSWESLPARFRPLPHRENVVVSRDPSFSAQGARVFNSIEKALQCASELAIEQVFIIGGGQIYTEALQLGLVDEMYLTHVDATFDDADVFFPAIELTAWRVEQVTHFDANDSNEFSGKILHYEKKDDAIQP